VIHRHDDGAVVVPVENAFESYGFSDEHVPLLRFAPRPLCQRTFDKRRGPPAIRQRPSVWLLSTCQVNVHLSRYRWRG
jgi:hypothetical protein